MAVTHWSMPFPDEIEAQENRPISELTEEIIREVLENDKAPIHVKYALERILTEEDLNDGELAIS